MFDAVSIFIKYLEETLRHAADDREAAEIRSLIEKAKEIKYRTQKVPA